MGILFGVFYFDATVTLVRRVMNGETWHSAHRSHAYQRAVQAGWGHARVTTSALGITALLAAGVALAAFWPVLTLPLLLVSVGLLICIYLGVERIRPMPAGERSADVGVAGTDRPLRVLYVVNAAWFFVAQRMAPAVELARRGVEVHVASAPDDTVEQITAAGLHHHPIALSRRGLNPFAELRVLLHLRGMYRRLEPDLAHHITIKAVVYGGIAARLARVPAVVHSISGMGFVFLAGGGLARLLRAIVQFAYRLAFRHPNLAIVFENSDDRAFFVQNRLVAPEQTVVIRGVGVELERFRGEAPRHDPPVVILPARLLRDKGVGEFVEAARLLRRRGKRVRMALVGRPDPGNPASVTEKMLKEWIAEGSVESWGWRDDMPEVFRSADVVCLPSYREGLPTALVEAAASGLPAVATDVPGCREIVAHGETGLLVPPRSATDLATAIESLVENPALRARLGRRARALAEQEYAVGRIVEQTLAVYQDLAGPLPYAASAAPPPSG